MGPALSVGWFNPRRVARFVFAAGLVIGASVSASPPGFAEISPTTTLSGTVLRGLSKLTPLGPTDPSTTISLGVGLAHPNDALEDAYLEALYTPGNPLFEQFLDPDTYQQQFGVPQVKLDALTGWLRSGGLTTTSVPGTTDYVLASGTAGQVQQLLNVRLSNFSIDGAVHYATTVDPTVPTSLGIEAIAGVDNIQGPRLIPHSSATPTRPAASAPAVPETGLTTPQVLWDIYDQPAVNKGEGQSMAIFGWGVTDGVVDDLRRFQLEYGLPATPITVNYYGAESQVTDTIGAVEWRLDTQASIGMAPNVTGEKLYFGKAGTDADLIAAYKGWVNDRNGPLQGSSSFSGCEEAPLTDSLTGGPGSPQGVLIFGNPNQDLYERALRQAVLEGRTMFASTGDTAASCPFTPLVLNGVTPFVTPLIGYPAGSRYAVGVGGTVLYWNPGTPNTRLTEYAWNYTGGGSSAFMRAGAYQEGTPPGLLVHCMTDPHGTPYPVPPPLCRGIPDFTAQSGDVVSNGYTITVNGANDQAGGGTSLSSPLWLGMWTLVQAAAPSRRGKGFANPTLYRMGKDPVKGARDFFDIGKGTPDAPPNCNGPVAPLECSHPGWDYVAGWGTPNVRGLLQDVDGGLNPTHPVPPPPPSTGVPPRLNPCGPVWTSAAGNDSWLTQQGQNPQLDLIRGNLALSADGLSLVTTLTVTNLSKSVPPGSGANVYYFLWSWNNIQYFSVVEVDPAGNVTFGDGQVQGNTYRTRSGSSSDTGTLVPGSNGTLTVNVPLAAVGAPPAGAILTAPNGQVRELLGTTTTGGLIEQVDQGGPQFDFQLGQACH